MWFIFNIQNHVVSPAVHILLPSVLQCLDSFGIRSSHPDPRKSTQLQIQCMTSSSVWYCFPAKCFVLFCFFHVWEQKVDDAKSGEFWGWSTSSKPQSCTAAMIAAQICVQKHCPRWWTSTFFVSFSGHFELSLVLLFNVLKYPTWVYLERNNAVSIRKGWIYCMPSFIAVAQLHLSQPMNFSAHPHTWLLYY